MIFSLKKIAEGDMLERAKLLYVIAPTKFETLAMQQGIEIESLEDVSGLVLDIKSGESDFNMKKLFRNIPISARELKQAGKQYKII